MLPILGWIKLLCDHVTQTPLGSAELEFVWRHEEVIEPIVQRENRVAFVNAGMMTRRHAAEIMGETLPVDPMADVLTVTTGQGVARLGANLVENGAAKSDGSINDDTAIFRKYSSERPRGADGQWVGASDIFNASSRDNDSARKPSGATTRSHSVVAVNIGVGGEGGKDDTPDEELSEQMYGVGPTGHADHGRILTPDIAAAAGLGAPASSFTGNQRFQLQSPSGAPARNDPATIDGVPYSGHALDQMQNRGLFPGVTSQTVKNGQQIPGNDSDTSVFYDPVNNVSVVRDNTVGNVITVIPGGRRKASK